MAEECSLDAFAAMVGHGGGARELRHPLMNAQTGAACDNAFAPRDEALEARGRERIAEDLLDDLAAERFVAGGAVERVGMKEARGHGIHPGGRVVGAGLLYGDAAVADRLQSGGIERQAEHVLEADELVAAMAEHPRDRRVSERRELHLQRRMTERERLFDGLELGRGREVAKAQPRQLVRRRSRSRVHRDTAADRRHDDLPAAQPRRRGAGELHEHRAFGALDPGGKRGSGKHDRRTAYMPRTTRTTRISGSMMATPAKKL